MKRNPNDLTDQDYRNYYRAVEEAIRRLFKTADGRRVFQVWMEDFVFVENPEMDPVQEGSRAFVLRLREIINGGTLFPEPTDEET